MIKTTESINGTQFHVTRPSPGKWLKKADTEELYEEAYDLQPYVTYIEIDKPDFLENQTEESSNDYI